MSEKMLVFWQRLFATLIFLVLLMGVSLIGASYLNDRKIESNLVQTTAEVLYATPTKAVINFYTQDGVNQNPKLGVLYPSKLKTGKTILVEYSKDNPELVRVAGRGYKLVILPVLFWTAISELILITLLLGNAFLYRKFYKKD